MLIQQGFVETKLATKFAQFNIRVYPDNQGKETVVLSTEHLDTTQPVLVRVHSECITGDMLGSLHCDCGAQLNKSLQLISETGGVLIYLRQEGRGIGLIEKMKSYKLQSQGYDTFEANTILGHQPDQRSYEMVKTILQDLNISRIRLLTNNPSKVSDIAKYGIEIVERVPLMSKPNKHNKRYLETKRNKFKHFFSKSTQRYFYQFHMDTAQHMKSILEFIKNRNKDPLLKIGVGITANHQSLTDKDDIERICSIVQVCSSQPELSPVIHFSFTQSADILADVKQIKKIWPSIKRLQLNDLPSIEIEVLKKICEQFSVDIPLSDEHFHVIHNVQFREVVKKHNSFIMLDNSKGKGIVEKKDVFIKKIDALLAYGINDIFLCGGFGPDHLETYFELQKFYRFNFSIDAETNLKTDNVIDPQKVKLYLLQLMRSDEPHRAGIEQTRTFMERHRRTHWEKTQIDGNEFSIHPKVFHAGHFPSTAWFASELKMLVKDEVTFCEIGCGSGVISCLIALANPQLRIVATDINPHATENTLINIEEHQLSDRISVFTGDVLDSVDVEAYFDSIFWALPFGLLDSDAQINFEDAQVFDPGYRAIRKFFQTSKNRLKPSGRLLIGFSSDLGHSALLEDLAQACSIRLRKIRSTIIKEDRDVRFEILEGHFI